MRSRLFRNLFNVGLRRCGAVLVTVLWGAVAHAEPSTMAAPLGGRSLLVGGTGVALGQDGSVPFLNPAAMSRIADTRLAFSVRLYNWTRAQYSGLVAAPSEWTDGLPPVKTTRNRFQGFPSTFCAFLTLKGVVAEHRDGFWAEVHRQAGSTKLGICGANIERSSLDVPAVGGSIRGSTGATAMELSMGSRWQRFALGPALSYQLDESWSFGASLHGVWTQVSNDWHVSALNLQPESQGLATLSRASRGRSIDGQTTYGILYNRGQQAWGLSVRVPAIHFEGKATANQTNHHPDSSAQVSLATGKFVAKPATVARIGVGREAERSRMEFDAAYFFGSQSAVSADLLQESFGREGVQSQRVRQRLGTQDVVTFQAGGEYLFSKKLSVLGGLELSPAILQRIPDRDPLIVGTRTSSVIGSVGLGSYEPGTELLIGARIGYEWGTVAAPRFEGSELASAERRAWETLLVLSGSVSLRALKRTVDGITELGSDSL